MRHLRFYVPFELRLDEKFRIPDEKARHIISVLRLDVGAEFVLFNGDGNEYTARLTEATKKVAQILITAKTSINRESNLHIHLIQGLSKGDRMDMTIQKCVELGVDLIQPVSTSRSNLKISPERMDKKHRHWLGVVHAACEQAGRNVIPELKPVSQFEIALNKYASFNGLKLILQPGAKKTLFQHTENAQQIVLLIGPEGGFSDEELLFAQSQGFNPLSLGSRTLRTETAAMAAIAGIQAKWGDI